jgi:undecaprenyl-diphosphatase
MPASLSKPRPVHIALGLLALVALVTLADPWAYTYLSFRGIYDQGWGRIVRTTGYLPFWLLAGLALFLSSRSAWAQRAALLLAGAPTAAGALGQVLKLLIRRGRPLANEGQYVFRAFTDRPFYSRDFGMPSGDVIVAFAAFAILARLWPRARILWYGLGLCCALGRVLVGAHFLSDVVVAAVLGWATAWVAVRLLPLPPSRGAT